MQSLDGELAFFEQTTATFVRTLPSFLVPGPLLYVPSSDLFVVAGAANTLAAYKYQALAAATAGSVTEAGERDELPAAGGEAAASVGAGKRVVAEWEMVLGEYVVDLRLARFSKARRAGQWDVVALCERSLVCLNGDSGEVRLEHRLGVAPVCMAVFPAGRASETTSAGDADALLVASQGGSLRVYRGSQLLWFAPFFLLCVASTRVASRFWVPISCLACNLATPNFIPILTLSRHAGRPT